MKLASITVEGVARIAAILDGAETCQDLQAIHETMHGHASPDLRSMHDLICADDRGLALAHSVLAWGEDRIAPISLSQVSLLSPVPEPIQMRDALCFELHCVQAFNRARELRISRAADPAAEREEMDKRGLLQVPKEFYDLPLYYKQNRFSVSGPDADVVWPKYSQVMDYELELGMFIGKPGIDIPRERALEHIFGYTIFNDFSARDAQFAEWGGGLGPTKGKDFKGANAVGPWIVTADEIGDPYSLEMIVRVNGEERGRGNSGSVYWRFEDLIARITEHEELRAGEFIGSGTVGNGSGLELMRYLEHGDVVELEIEKIGILRNRVLRPEVAA